MEFSHVSVMPTECIEGLNIKPNGIYVDGTTGGGGHSRLIARKLGPEGRLICLDRDSDALNAARENLKEYLDKITFIKTNFENIKEALASHGIFEIDGLLLDLGVSSYQLDNPQRGFSYMNDAPLDMRMDREDSLTAFDIVNGYDVLKLKDIISRYGEERYAYSIASAIGKMREKNPINTTFELVDIIRSAMPAAAKREKQHPAKRTFQAIRIEVNGEIDAVARAVSSGIDLLAPKGRIAVISFHSLEDREVKRIFAARSRACICPKEQPVCTCTGVPEIKLTPKGIIEAGEQEVADNPRARSAKLRIAEKT